MESEHDDYLEALRRVQRALATGATEVSLSDLELERLPQELAGLTSLQHLDLSRCSKLSDLSPLAGLTSLQHLDLDGCMRLHDLSPLAGLTSLQHLDLGNWDYWQLPDLSPLASLATLHHLALRKCWQLQDLSPLAGLTSLQHLDLSECRRLSDLSPLAGLTSLQHLDLSGCGELDVSPLTGLTGLQRLDLSECAQLQALSALAALTNLQHLDLSKCKQLRALPPLTGLTSLQRLDMSGCGQLQALSPLISLTGLQQLDLSGCAQLRALPPLTGLTSLQHLDLSRCDQLWDLSPLTGLKGLQQLNLSGCGQLWDLSPLTGLTGLQQLNLSGCDQLPDLSPLASLTDLQELNLSRCDQLPDLSPLASLTSLQQLSLSGGSPLPALPPLAGLTSLQRLDLSGRGEVDLSPLASLPDLQQLNLSQCDQLPDLSPLVSLMGLQQLNMSGCNQLPDLSPLASLTGLQQLYLSGCNQLPDLSPLASLTGLQQLDLSGCDQLLDLSPLASLTGLQNLNLSRGKKLRDLSPLNGLAGLQYLDLSRCEEQSELSPLTGLTSLQRLDLRECRQLETLPPLTGLTSLQEINVTGCTQLRALSPLTDLTSLQQLDLSQCTQLEYLSPLVGLTSLRHLNLTGCKQLPALSPLTGLTSLQRLDLRECRQLKTLPPLTGLTSLQYLDAWGCGQLQALPPLTGLTSLKHLILSRCEQLQTLPPLTGLRSLRRIDLSECRQLKTLPSLTGLTSLQVLDVRGCELLQAVPPLIGLTGLKELGLSRCEQLRDLSPLIGLTGLKELGISRCEKLQDLMPLSGLRTLELVNLFAGSFLDCSPAVQPLASWNCLQRLLANRLTGAPTELGSSNVDDNALPRIRAWQADLLAGEASNSTVKLFVLGNGRVGKTQICRRIRGEAFDPSIPSTHGISLGRFRLSDASGDYYAVDANVWDFGGQDVYLGTHALFLDERAIYVVAWTPQYENTEESELDSVPVRNRPLAYWLEYVRSLAGPLAPVIVVQTQCDRESDVQLPPLPATHGFERAPRATSSSAKRGDGMDGLRVELKSAARFLLDRYGKVRLPASWVAVGKELRARVRERTLPRAEFDDLCRAQHGASVPDVVLEYLHRSGQVFWRQGVFGNRLVLDLAWALDGVYAVLERNTSLSIIRSQAGRFSRHLLALLVWQKYGEQEQYLFLSLMEQCQICFKVTDDVFIAPALLPSQAEKEGDIAQIWHGAIPDAVAHLDYPFLHEGVVRGMLCGLGREAGVHAVYWAYGVCFYDAHYSSSVRIFSNVPDISGGKSGGNITVEAAGPGATPLVQHLLASIQRINIGQAPVLTWELRQPVHDSPTVEKEPLAEEQAFKAISPAQPPRPPEEPHAVYVSYAWGKESSALVDELERRFPADLKLKRDRNELRPGDWISPFMKEIGRADLVVMILSDKYLRSIYCMREMLYLFQRSQGERERLMPKVVPLRVGELPILRARDRLKIVQYWKDEHDELEAALKLMSPATIGQQDREELLMLKDFQHRVSDILAWIADTVMPQQTELSEQRIDVVINLLKQRAAKSRPDSFHS